MSVRLIETTDPDNGADRVALYDSVTGWAFGPVFASAPTAYRFVDFAQDAYGRDVRQLDPAELRDAYARFCRMEGAS